VTYVIAQHSSRFPDGTYGGNPGGFVIETNEGNFYHAGDTALTMDMKLIGARYKLDFALLPIGSNYTMDYIDACTCAEFIQCDKIIGMHYDTFPPIKIDHEKATHEFERNGKELLLMKIGETINF
jgi:L-ascorbate metabolism protein UlaG (beta-lactamase superfamily)